MGPQAMLTAERAHHAPSPFDLASEAAYRHWREQKLRHRAREAQELLVELRDPRQLSPAEQQNFLTANNFFKIARIQLNEDGTVVLGDWDFGYKTWRLINNDRDIEMKKNDGTTDVLRNWSATATRFTYTPPSVFMM